jgi:hypothetical protein
VDFLDAAIESLRTAGTAESWNTFYRELMTDKRATIDALLWDVTEHLKIGWARRRSGPGLDASAPG